MLNLNMSHYYIRAGSNRDEIADGRTGFRRTSRKSFGAGRWEKQQHDPPITTFRKPPPPLLQQWFSSGRRVFPRVDAADALEQSQPARSEGRPQHVRQRPPVLAVHVPRVLRHHRSVLVPPARGRRRWRHWFFLALLVERVPPAQHLQSGHVLHVQQLRIPPSAASSDRQANEQPIWHFSS